MNLETTSVYAIIQVQELLSYRINRGAMMKPKILINHFYSCGTKKIQQRLIKKVIVGFFHYLLSALYKNAANCARVTGSSGLKSPLSPSAMPFAARIAI